jgi:glutaredoxin-related protein
MIHSLSNVLHSNLTLFLSIVCSQASERLHDLKSLAHKYLTLDLQKSLC